MRTRIVHVTAAFNLGNDTLHGEPIAHPRRLSTSVVCEPPLAGGGLCGIAQGRFPDGVSPGNCHKIFIAQFLAGRSLLVTHLEGLADNRRSQSSVIQRNCWLFHHLYYAQFMKLHNRVYPLAVGLC